MIHFFRWKVKKWNKKIRLYFTYKSFVRLYMSTLSLSLNILILLKTNLTDTKLLQFSVLDCVWSLHLSIKRSGPVYVLYVGSSVKIMWTRLNTICKNNCHCKQVYVFYTIIHHSAFYWYVGFAWALDHIRIIEWQNIPDNISV